MKDFALLGWIPCVALLFALTRPSRALVLAYLVGWMFLPMGEVAVEGFWDINKTMAINFGAVLGIVLFCPARLNGFRLLLPDYLLIGFGLVTMASSATNGLGIYNGFSVMTAELSAWAVPYWLGRTVLRSREDLIDAARIVVVGAGLYAILAIWEWRMSPQVHHALYGEFQHRFGQHKRWGFYRPVICFPHALSLSVFMTWITLLGLSLWRAGKLRKVAGMPAWTPVALTGAAVLCSMSLTPWVLLAAGVAALLTWNGYRSRVIVLLPVVASLVWMAGRYTSTIDGGFAVDIVSQVWEERSDSLHYRFECEDALLAKGKDRPLLGWGGAGRNQVFSDSGRVEYANDALWLIWVGQYGLAGLLLYFAWWVWPVVLSLNASRTLETDPVTRVVLIAVGLQAINAMVNGVTSPVLTLMCGAATAALLQMRRPNRVTAIPMVRRREVRVTGVRI